MSSSQRLAFPLLAPGQAQKEVFHNEALQILDILVAAAVEEPPRSSPPSSPAAGACYVIGESPSGAWAGRAGQLAGWTSGGWRFVDPVEGMTAVIRSSGLTICYRSGGWELGVLRANALHVAGQQVVGPRGAAIADPSGGTAVDAEARSAILAMLSALRAHGLIA